jgi:endo-1,4-beta-D-glucanase Y
MNEAPETSNNRLGAAGWFAIIVLLGFLAAAIAYAVHAWEAMSGVNISPLGWLFMGLGVFFTIAVGGGLMALVFYSSRHNYDQ